MNAKIETRYCVYMHIFPNGKRYIGITGQKPKDRWRVNGHGYNPQRLMKRAIKKYGWDNIEHIIVAENLTAEDAGNLEKKLIEKYKTTNSAFGYNQSIGGENSPIGVKRSEETRKKLSISHMGQAHNKGYHLREEQRQHLRKINLGKKLSEETKKKISEKNKGTKPSELAIRKAIAACSKPVIQLSTGKIFSSATEASKQTGEPLNTITNHCRKEVRRRRWEYVKIL